MLKRPNYFSILVNQETDKKRRLQGEKGRLEASTKSWRFPAKIFKISPSDYQPINAVQKDLYSSAHTKIGDICAASGLIVVIFVQDWDKPQHIPDPDATKPDDWDDEIDGEWEPPQIDNPEYKGEWKPKQIKNPNYKGVWVHPEIDNPEYSPDDKLYKFDDIGALGFDLWQVG